MEGFFNNPQFFSQLSGPEMNQVLEALEDFVARCDPPLIVENIAVPVALDPESPTTGTGSQDAASNAGPSQQNVGLAVQNDAVTVVGPPARRCGGAAVPSRVSPPQRPLILAYQPGLAPVLDSLEEAARNVEQHLNRIRASGMTGNGYQRRLAESFVDLVDDDDDIMVLDEPTESVEEVPPVLVAGALTPSPPRGSGTNSSPVPFSLETHQPPPQRLEGSCDQRNSSNRPRPYNSGLGSYAKNMGDGGN